MYNIVPYHMTSNTTATAKLTKTIERIRIIVH